MLAKDKWLGPQLHSQSHFKGKELIKAIDQATDLAVSQGIRVLQTHFYGNQEAHVLRHLEIMNPPQGARIIDAGSGVGEVARIMSKARPDLRFTMINFSQHQLDISPTGEQFLPVLADFTDTGLSPGLADIVMFNSSLCQMPINHALSEARRLLKPNGELFVSDLAIDQYREINELYATFMPLKTWQDVIVKHGFAVNGEAITGTGYDIEHFRSGFGDNELFDDKLSGIQPFVSRFTKKESNVHIADTLARHEKIAFEFSGGKDSIVTFDLLLPHLDKITVYHVTSGDALPETREVIERYKKIAPNFIEINGNVKQIHADFGIPSDIIPVSSTDMGRQTEEPKHLLQSRYDCCARTIMNPLHNRVINDGNTLIIRGQKSADKLKGIYKSGAVIGGIELLFPIEDYTDEDVYETLSERDIEAPAYYGSMNSAPDCASCSAYWDEGRADYLKENHPQHYKEYMAKLAIIQDEVMPYIESFNREIK